MAYRKSSPGNPKIFKTEESFKDKFFEYIKYCDKKERFPNIAGFSVYNNMSRETFYKQQEYFPSTYRMIRAALEDETLNSDKLKGAEKIFYMKNAFKELYKDRQELDVTANVNVQIENFNNEYAE